jgi:serine phosphatase RsbU (regulator of sigma subunit)
LNQSKLAARLSAWIRMLPFDEGAGRLSPGDSILLYSDGVTECTGNSGPFGLDGLTEVLGQCVGLPPASTCGKIITSLRHFAGGAAMQDDVTLLALTYDGGGHLANESIAALTDTHLPPRGN